MTSTESPGHGTVDAGGARRIMARQALYPRTADWEIHACSKPPSPRMTRHLVCRVNSHVIFVHKGSANEAVCVKIFNEYLECEFTLVAFILRTQEEMSHHLRWQTESWKNKDKPNRLTTVWRNMFGLDGEHKRYRSTGTVVLGYAALTD